MRNMKLINDFKMEKVAKKVLEVMAEKQMTLAEAEVFPEYLERTIKKTVN